MLHRLFCVVAAFVAAVVAAASPASADAPEVVLRSHLAGPAPALTAACGFEVTRVVDVIVLRYSDKHMRGIVTGTWTGPTGRSFTQTNRRNSIVRGLPDGTLAYSVSGHISILHVGHELQSFPDGDTVMLSVGHDVPLTSYCDELSP
jgi:hypothetical protein